MKEIDNKLTQKFDEYPSFGVLKGVKVFVTGTNIAGPFAGCLMAEMGAKVLQAEAPTIACQTRGTLAWSQNHRNEYSITINSASPAGKKIFLKCVEWADIWIEAGRPGSYVPADETIEAFTRICDGVYDDVPEQAFSGIGGIDDLEEKWHNMQKELGA